PETVGTTSLITVESIFRESEPGVMNGRLKPSFPGPVTGCIPTPAYKLDTESKSTNTITTLLKHFILYSSLLKEPVKNIVRKIQDFKCFLFV
ncbi:MAG: hypothetical protein J7L74_02390, partial [Candidatus Hydrothermae bacterium]|nr:hypothetical protein [Candidatus Hydrothermae bacterium]